MNATAHYHLDNLADRARDRGHRRLLRLLTAVTARLPDRGDWDA